MVLGTTGLSDNLLQTEPSLIIKTFRRRPLVRCDNFNPWRSIVGLRDISPPSLFALYQCAHWMFFDWGHLADGCISSRYILFISLWSWFVAQCALITLLSLLCLLVLFAVLLAYMGCSPVSNNFLLVVPNKVRLTVPTCLRISWWQVLLMHLLALPKNLLLCSLASEQPKRDECSVCALCRFLKTFL